MAPAVFPVLPGQGWSVHKRPNFATRVASHISGREVRRATYAQTLYEFELTYDALAASASPALAGIGGASLQTLLGFYLACQGRLGTFLYLDPTDSSVTNQTIATADGTTTTFVLQRQVGAFIEPVSWVTSVTGVSVNGAAQTGWALSQPNTIVLASTPAAGAVVSASFAYAYLCRFLDDTQDFENVMNGLWQLKSLKFRSVRTS